MPKNKSIIHQVQEVLNQKLRIGEQRHSAKQLGVSSEGIYSWGTHKTYLAKGCAFARWVKENYNCRTLVEARPYVDVYIQHYIDSGYKAATQKTIANALAKLYGCSIKDFIPTEPRLRADITRSRQGKALTRFSESRNREFVDFCRATGLRKHEFDNLRAENLHYNDTTGEYMIVDLKGKGGRLRELPVLSKEAVERIKKTPLGQKVWDKIPTNADVHSYRADYCAAIYERHARPLAEIPKKDRYCCRKDLKGVVYDKRAMAIASLALGYDRIEIMATSYLYSVAQKQLTQLAELKGGVGV